MLRSRPIISVSTYLEEAGLHGIDPGTAGCSLDPHSSHACFSFSGWPIYTRETMPEQAVYDVCEAIVSREAEIPWEERAWSGIAQPFTETDSTPMDVPLHPGTERWLAENAGRLG